MIRDIERVWQSTRHSACGHVAKALVSPLLLPCMALWSLSALPAQAALPPPYLAVKGFQQCMMQKPVQSYRVWCMPARKPQACLADSWQALRALKAQGQLQSCRSAAPNIPAPGR